MPRGNLPNPFSLQDIGKHPLYEKALGLLNVHEKLRPLSDKERNIFIRHSIAAIMGIGINAENAASASEHVWPDLPRGAWRQSIGKDSVTCLICGQKMERITREHLRGHGCGVVEYKRFFGIPGNVQLARGDPEYRAPAEIPNPFKLKNIAGHPLFEKAMALAKERQKVMPMAPEEANAFIREAIAEMMGVDGARVKSMAAWPKPESPDAWQDSIAHDEITCMICGGKMRLLTNAHLRRHGGDKNDYRRHFGFPPDVQLACPDLLEEKRRSIAKNQIWKFRNGGKIRSEKRKAESAEPVLDFNQLLGLNELD